MGSLKILSVNCQGLGDIGKRRDVFNFLRSKNIIYIVYKIPISLVILKTM